MMTSMGYPLSAIRYPVIRIDAFGERKAASGKLNRSNFMGYPLSATRYPVYPASRTAESGRRKAEP
jgi:hypothetical protein